MKVKRLEKGRVCLDPLRKESIVSEEPGSSKKRKQSKNAEKERQDNLKGQKVLLGRVFDTEIVEKHGMKELMKSMYTDDSTLIFSVNGVHFAMYEPKLGDILGVPTDGLKTVEGKTSDDFKILIVKGEGPIMLPRAERRYIASIADLSLFEVLVGFNFNSLPALIIEHMIKVANAREGKYGLPYVFFLTKVFTYFNVPTGNATQGNRKQMFTMTTLEKCECVPKKDGMGNNFTISSLIEAQERATADIERLQGKNALLRAQLVKQAGEPGPSSKLATTKLS
ncbi:hypothetical protein RND71_008170 [Anisodus tanguticus]|uniref:Uncharacterized protein n=1 Tax=Anisodus tanguticus TaxID=243964 RepID=A0AAE1SQC1_9SOLA|nr:hypothetical protein RND71_008170 [Anisodus tanguticus]